MHQCDVVILGSGPAGATAALTLRKSYPDLSVLMVEASDAHAPRPGEILSEDALPILQQLTLLDFFKDQKHPAIANSAANSGSKFAAFAPSRGWYLDRSRFDSMLSGYAAASGTAFYRGALTGVQFLSDGRWQVTAQSAATTHTSVARFVVDATGRHARFANEIGVPQLTYDSMIGIVRIINLEGATHLGGSGPMIEAFEHGWWYSAMTSNNQLAIVAMTDADLGKRLQLTHVAQWIEHMRKSPRTYELAGDLKMQGDLSIRAANTRCLHACSGENWLAVGDAASSFDPLTSDGVLRALRLGNRAAHVIGAHFNKSAALKDYQSELQAEFEKNMNRRMEIYRSETRWKNSAFWMRRQTQPAAPGGIPSRKSTISISNGLTNVGGSQPKTAIAP